MELEKIAAAYEQTLAHLMHSELESKGFHPTPLIFISHVAFGGGENAWFIEVPVEEASKARAVLQAAGHGERVVGDSPEPA